MKTETEQKITNAEYWYEEMIQPSCNCTEVLEKRRFDANISVQIEILETLQEFLRLYKTSHF
jgi:hypothetical protein